MVMNNPSNPSNQYNPSGIYAPAVGSWSCTTSTVPYPPNVLNVYKISCPLPGDALEKLLALGIVSNKEMLKTKLMEAYQNWCDTQTIDPNLFPMLLVTCLLSLGVDFSEELEKGREKEKTKEKEG